MWSLRSPRARFVLSAAAVSGVLVLAGCSDNSSGGGHDMSQMSNNTSGTTTAAVEANAFNNADVMFLQMMYPHHAQAVEMANMVEGRSTNPQVLDLAKNIAAAQGPEMEQMTALLAQRGMAVPSTDASGGMSGMNHGGTSAPANGTMSGMMTPEQMTELAGKSGADFDTAWLNMMIEHHTGAIEMAQTELADGENADAKQLATDIVGAQQAEITTMTALLPQN
ncbi:MULTISPECIES: DUF305 domain-containing protein [unclassified Rhodococcus (in: high G+C Gram-positive bacteria)]|uniref:DUF305 domain-containing protein n=1 Tax=unclassified Rhodococcus (in: high G+C Gram-positive bacteria) TaxID=192944 RepID=UPI001639CB81|nr:MULTISPECIES: DUF305 domain-containing protein [unclassified Rhodococcus (in: high G+C Gram-positive bacteria)]MBC2644848.1 DUF305 domain-containing protein [Rhodococcus sp. 3A]MBC2890849.1 DUF305 domain-containing protein [Rhodococcus sp. 4CII]